MREGLKAEGGCGLGAWHGRAGASDQKERDVELWLPTATARLLCGLEGSAHQAPVLAELLELRLLDLKC